MSCVTKEPKAPDEAFGQNVATVRGWRTLSQKEFAARLSKAGFKVDAPAVSRIESGSRAVRLAEAITIANVLDVELSLLIAGIDRSPDAELKSARRVAQAAFEAMRKPLVDFLNAYVGVHDELRRNPDLVSMIRVGPDGIDTPNEYFRWAAERIGAIEERAVESDERDPEGDYAVYLSEVQRAGMSVVVDAYLDAVFISAEQLAEMLEEPVTSIREAFDGTPADSAE